VSATSPGSSLLGRAMLVVPLFVSHNVLRGAEDAVDTSAAARAAAITVHLGAVISSDDSRADHAEAWVAVDPQKPGRAVVVSIVGPGDESVAYATADGGRTWKRGLREGPDGNRFAGLDPVAVFGSHGTAYLGTISPFRVWRSQDGGLTWTGPVVVPGRSYDREYLTVSRGVIGPDTLYGIGKIPIKIFGHLADDVLALTRSADDGRTFEYPRLVLPDPTRSIIHTPGGLVVLPNGKLLISFLAHDVPVTDPALVKNHIWVLRSDDGGRTFGEPVAAAATVVHGNAGDPVKMAKSLAMAGLVIDTAPASPYRGRLYLSWLSVDAGRLQVFVASSSDTGRSWSAPVRVNDDIGAANHSNPTLGVNDEGVVVALWNDRRADSTDACFRATVSASLDGGATFLPSIPLAANQVCPVGPGPIKPFSTEGFRERYLNGGETQGVASLPGGRFLAAFIDDVGGALQLRSATIEVTRDAARR
jgi:hypothetical protein